MNRLASLLLLAGPWLLGPRPANAQGFAPTREEESKLVKVLGLSPGKIVAEIGAGEGQLSIRVAQAVSPGGRAYASELGEAKRATLKRNTAKAGARNVEVIEAQESATGLKAGCCDVVFMRDVYHHLTVPEAILGDIRKALRPDGRLLVIDFEPRSSLGRVEGVRENRGGHGVPRSVLVEELKAAGFEVVSEDPAWRSDLYAVVAQAPPQP
jgi:precorrin-6B methylase 2